MKTLVIFIAIFTTSILYAEIVPDSAPATPETISAIALLCQVSQGYDSSDWGWMRAAMALQHNFQRDCQIRYLKCTRIKPLQECVLGGK